MFLSFKEEVIRKRKEELKEEKELERIQAKRNLDFLDIVLLARVCRFSVCFFMEDSGMHKLFFRFISDDKFSILAKFTNNKIIIITTSSVPSKARTPVETHWLRPQ